LSVRTVRVAWRDPSWQPLGYNWRFTPRAVVARAIILVAVAVLMIAVTVASALTGTAAKAVTLIGGVPGIVGVLAGGLLAVTLTSSAKPVALVPPRFRAGTGLSPAQRQGSDSR
jgi:hypothetical protein